MSTTTTTTTTTTLTHTLLTTLTNLRATLLNLAQTSLQHLYDKHRPLRHKVVLFLGAAAAPFAVFVLLPRIRADYAAYLSIGPGGPPHNFLGYLGVKAMGPVGRGDTRGVPGPYVSGKRRRAGQGDGQGQRGGDGGSVVGSSGGDDGFVEGILKRYAPYGGTSFLGLSSGGTQTDNKNNTSDSLPPRPGPRPTVPSFVAPQRQTTGVNPATVPRMQRFLRSLTDANPGLFEMRPSGLEGGKADAVWLKAGTGTEGERGKDVVMEVPGYMGIARGEIAHVHGEGSSHLTLSLVDAEEAVGKGWAERHRLSGVGKILPWGYLIVYAPRDDGEYEVWKRLVVAACRFVSGVREVALPSSDDTL